MRATPFLVAALMLAACPGATPPSVLPPPPAVVTTFTVTPNTVANAGEMVTLAWETRDAKHLALEQLGKGQLAIDATAASGTTQVAVDADATFVLTATGEGGTDSAVQSVTLQGGGGEPLFTASPKTVEFGGQVTLVWNVPGADSVTVKDASGVALDLKGQKGSGSIIVAPASSTHYDLQAGDSTARVDVTVLPAVLSFTSSGSPRAGETFGLSWRTSGGTKLTLTRADLATPVHVETDSARIAAGGFTDTAPANLPVDGLLSYRLQLESGPLVATSTLSVRIGGALKLNRLTVPSYVRTGAQYAVSWQTTGASYLELQLDGRTVYVAPDQASVDSGSATMAPLESATTRLQLVARNGRGGEVIEVRNITTVGIPTFNSFTADRGSIGQGGEPVVLSWDVTNARNVTITQTGAGIVHTAAGVVDTGSVTVYPNRSSTVYTLTASNGAGNSVMPQTVTVTVTTVAKLTYQALVPVGASGKVSGHTVLGGTEIWGLPTVEENRPGEAFVDIVSTGTSIAYSGPDTTAKLVTLPEVFSTVLYGKRVSNDKISISINGWFLFSGTAISGADNNSPFPSTALEPLAIAPYWDDLYDIGPSEIYYQLDTVNGERRLIVQWNDIEHDDYPGSHLTFQAQVFSSGKVVYAYQRLDGVTTIDPSVGVVSPTEVDAVIAPSAPAVGKTFTFFSKPATLPFSMRIESAPYLARVAVGSGFIEVEGDGRLPPAQFGITEVNPRPGTTVTNGEWIEVTNFSSNLISLSGWTIDFGGGSTHTITNLLLPPNGIVLLAQSVDLGDPTAGISATYVYPATLSMPDTSGSVSISIGGLAYSTATWSSTSQTGAGISVRIDGGRPGAVYASPSCSSTGTGTYGVQTGTPGQTQPVCVVFPYQLSEVSSNFETLASTGTQIHAGGDEAVVAVTLPSPIRYLGADVSTIYVSTNGWITTTSTTSATNSNRSTPAAATPVGSIAPFWDDMTATSGAGVGIYRISRDPDGMAASGDEYTIISWEHFRRFGDVGQNLNFQVKFFANGNIEYHYGTMDPVGSELTYLGNEATSWLESPTGQIALAININSSNAPGIHANTAFRFAYTP